MDDKSLTRFWGKVEKTDGCWNWKACRNQFGYGRFFLNKPRRLKEAHRIAYELIKGKIPNGLTLDHLCRNPSCVNPDHLEPVTMRENNLRGYGASGKNGRKTHCPKGHPLVEGNLVVSFKGRLCLTCQREYQRLSKRKRRLNPNYRW